MTLFMLDTNAATAALRGSPQVDARLSSLAVEDWCISAVTRAELRFGLALRPDATQLARIVNAFLEVATTMPWDEAAADRHGALRAKLRQQGAPIGDFDEMIGAHALALEAVLVTDNEKHFRRIEGLTVENWVRTA
jgi:tRNA(fMet)-specific endonuclease VapC